MEQLLNGVFFSIETFLSYYFEVFTSQNKFSITSNIKDN